MGLKQLAIIPLLVLILVISGCVQNQPQPQLYDCTSGDKVSNPNLCPGGSSNVITQEAISQTTNQQSSNENIPPAPYCGDKICQTTENSNICPLDCGCPAGFTLESNTCVELKPLIKASFKQSQSGYYGGLHSVTILMSQNNGINLGTLLLLNTGNDDIKSLHVSVDSPQGYFEKKEFDYDYLPKNQTQNTDIYLNFNDKILQIVDPETMTLSVSLTYTNSINKEFSQTETFDYKVLGRNSISDEFPTSYGALVSPKQPVIREFGSKSTSNLAAALSQYDEVLAAYWLFQSMKSYGIAYVNDISNIGDYVQLPYETIKNKNGDCEDLAILYASLLEGVGIRSGIVVIPGHAFGGFYTFDGNFVPVETTANDFMSALLLGQTEYAQHYKQGDLSLVDVRGAWKKYPSIIMPNEPSFPMPDISKQVGKCSMSFNLPDLWVASANIQFTNNGNAPGAGCAVVTTYDGKGIQKDVKYDCWTIQPRETKNVTLQPDIDLLQGFSCTVK